MGWCSLHSRRWLVRRVHITLAKGGGGSCPMNILGVCDPFFGTAFGVGHREKLKAWTYAAASRDCTRLCLDCPIVPYSAARSERENPPPPPSAPLSCMAPPFCFASTRKGAATAQALEEKGVCPEPAIVQTAKGSRGCQGWEGRRGCLLGRGWKPYTKEAENTAVD